MHCKRTGQATGGLGAPGTSLALILVAGGFFGSCVSTAPPRQSAAQEKVGMGTVSAAELRTRIYELAERLGGTVEVAADQIRAKSTDPVVRRRALLWKADGIL